MKWFSSKYTGILINSHILNGKCRNPNKKKKKTNIFLIQFNVPFKIFLAHMRRASQ